MVIFVWARSTDRSTIPVLCLRFSDWPLSIHNWVYNFQCALSDPFSDVYALRCFRKKAFSQYILKCLLFSKPFSSSVPLKNSKQ